MLETIVVIFRTIHILSAAAWLGGSIFYAFVLIPSLKEITIDEKLRINIARRFQAIVSIAMWLLLASGGILTFDRLSNTRLGTAYASVLVLKVALAIWMFFLAGSLRRNRRKAQYNPYQEGVLARWRGTIPVPWVILVTGIVVFLLGAILTTMYQSTS